MKVALIQETLDARRGGAETATLEMARHLARRGLEVTIFCREAHELPPAEPNLAITPLPVRRLTRAGRAYAFVQRVHRLHLRLRFDIIHAITPCLAANVYQPRGGTYPETIFRSTAMVLSPALRATRRFGRRFNIRQRFLQRLEKILLTRRRRQVHVAAVSDYVRRQVCAAYSFPAERVRVVFNGVDIVPMREGEAQRARAELRGRLQLGPQTPLMLFAAHNFKLKGLGELIRAMTLRGDRGSREPAIVGDSTAPDGAAVPDWHLVVAGRDNPAPYAKIARRTAAAERLHFVGIDTPVRAWYAAADLLVHPTWYDPCSRVVLEALSLGLPVVTTRLNGAAEAMTPVRHGEVIDSPDDVLALAGAIERALRPEVRAACKEDAADMLARCSMERHAAELEVLYRFIKDGERRLLP